MDIGLIYSKKDPRQTEVRDFVRDYIQKHGILASIIESEQPVASPTLIVNGYTLKERRCKPRARKARMFPGIQEMVQVLEQHVWML